MIHLAINFWGVVVAQFMHSSDAANFCRGQELTHVPFNSDKHQVPAVGTVYEAWVGA